MHGIALSANDDGGDGFCLRTCSPSSGSSDERATREERAAKSLQTASRVMLVRKGRLQRRARETSALLVTQKRSREWLKQKQGADT